MGWRGWGGRDSVAWARGWEGGESGINRHYITLLLGEILYSLTALLCEMLSNKAKKAADRRRRKTKTLVTSR